METNQPGTEFEVVSRLLRAELSAVQTYDHVIKQVPKEEGGNNELRAIQQRHRGAIESLRTQFGASSADVGDANVWENLEAVATSGGNPLKDPMSIKALKEGEEIGLLTYENALSRGEATQGLGEIIREKLVPQARDNIRRLKKLLEAA
jgi:hypothetical protein